MHWSHQLCWLGLIQEKLIFTLELLVASIMISDQKWILIANLAMMEIFCLPIMQ
jgi:hypothetical protein